MRQYLRRFLPSLGGLIRGEVPTDTMTEAIPVIDDAMAVGILDLAVRIGQTMLATGASASDVTSGTPEPCCARSGAHPSATAPASSSSPRPPWP